MDAVGRKVADSSTGEEVAPVIQDARTPLRPTIARVSLSALAHNYRALRAVASPAEVCAVVKANAYGHGMGPVAQRLQQEGCRIFAVGTVDEGVELRRFGIEEEILVLQGAPRGCARLLSVERLTPVISDLASLQLLGQESLQGGISLPVHLKFDTGMGRLGLRPEEAGDVHPVFRRLNCIQLSGVTTHFARAGESPAATTEQLERFRGALDALAAGGMSFGAVHAANSAALLSDPASHFDFVRVGLSLYGVSPEPALPLAPALSPVLTWVSEVEHLREVPAGSPLSYGGTFVTRAPSRIAVVPVGYADGYRRALGNRGQVLIRGQRAPVVGRVTMDLTLVDVTSIAGVERGDEVILLGSQGGQTLSATEMAAWLDTISYEVLCCIGARVPRVYGENG